MPLTHLSVSDTGFDSRPLLNGSSMLTLSFSYISFLSFYLSLNSRQKHFSNLESQFISVIWAGRERRVGLDLFLSASFSNKMPANTILSNEPLILTQFSSYLYFLSYSLSFHCRQTNFYKKKPLKLELPVRVREKVPISLSHLLTCITVHTLLPFLL